MSNSTTISSAYTTAASSENVPVTTWDDATWILTSAFIIFTMQSGFGLLESGSVSSKNEVNIMAKNVADVIFGGISYWMLGYGLSFGDGDGSNGFCGVGKFFIDPDDSVMGEEFSRFVFQSSFATTATTIVSGAIAERCKFLAYIIFSFFNTFVFCFPAHWVWSDDGWLRKLGVVDVAGDGPVHLVGGVTSLVATLMIKPRAKRFTPEDDHVMGSPTSALLGLFTLWWGWLAFNCGSTYGISGGKWKMAARAAATTLMSASSAGVVGFAGSYLVNNKKFYIPYLINSVLGGLVAITATCAVTGIWESLVIGAVGAVLVLLSDAAFVRLRIDDPVSAISVHGVGGIWGLLCAGFFTHKDTITESFADRHGLVKGGGFYLLGVQALACVAITVWSAVSAGLILLVLDLTMGLRMSLEEELTGADILEHNIQRLDLVQIRTIDPMEVAENGSSGKNVSNHSRSNGESSNGCVNNNDGQYRNNFQVMDNSIVFHIENGSTSSNHRLGGSLRVPNSGGRGSRSFKLNGLYLPSMLSRMKSGKNQNKTKQNNKVGQSRLINVRECFGKCSTFASKFSPSDHGRSARSVSLGGIDGSSPGHLPVPALFTLTRRSSLFSGSRSVVATPARCLTASTVNDSLPECYRKTSITNSSQSVHMLNYTSRDELDILQ